MVTNAIENSLKDYYIHFMFSIVSDILNTNFIIMICVQYSGFLKEFGISCKIVDPKMDP